jgi:hypothetical protein
MKIEKCQVCGAEFEKTHNKVTCGPECSKRNNILLGIDRRNASVLYHRQQKESKVIELFPAEIDRDEFGTWLSGFTDGEGSFVLTLDKRDYVVPKAHFGIALRDDDAEILYQIQSYFDCGGVYPVKRRKMSNGRMNNPGKVFGIGNTVDLVREIIPQFENYPLRAKKRHDFLIWKEGVLLMYEVLNRRHPKTSDTNKFLAKWTELELERFTLLEQALKEQRKYRKM